MCAYVIDVDGAKPNLPVSEADDDDDDDDAQQRAVMRSDAPWCAVFAQ